MSEPKEITREKCVKWLDDWIRCWYGAVDETGQSMLQSIRKLIVKPTYELDDGTVCCRHCGTVLGYKEDFEGSTNVQMEQPGVTDLDIAHWMDRCHELEVELAELTKKLSEVKLDVQNPNRLDLEKPETRVSREDVEKAVQSCEQEFPIISKGWDIFGPVVIAILTKLGFRVEGLGTQD